MRRLYLSHLSLLLVLLCIALVATPVAAQTVYQWKDAQGVTHYADSPPAGKAYKNRSIRQSGSASTVEAIDGTGKPVENTNCKIAHNNLDRLKSGVAVGIDRDGDGKPEANLTQQERETQTRLAQSTIDVACTKNATAAN